MMQNPFFLDANGIIYDELDASHQWSDGEVKDYDYVQ